ncbi:MAG TPA: hypothetical protein PLQ35_00220 [bacterium]|nr:hypothetical protein [bacterium]HQL60693.1 hypothetical protein [bacterium]
MTIRVSQQELANLAVFSPDGTKLLTCGNSCVLWDVATGERVKTFRQEWGGISAAAFSPDGRYAITGAYIYEAVLWDLQTGEAIHKFISPSVDGPYLFPDPMVGVAFSPDGQKVMTGDTHGILQVWDVHTGEEIRRYERYAAGFFPGFTSMPNGVELIGSIEGNGFNIFNVETGEQSSRLRSCIVRKSFSLSRDGTIILTDCGRLYDTDTGKMLRDFSMDASHGPNSVALSPDGKLAILGSASNAGHTYPRMIFNADDGTLLRSHPLSGETGDPHSLDKQVLFAPDGKRYITINGDTSVYFWDISDLAAGVKKAEEYEKRE